MTAKTQFPGTSGLTLEEPLMFEKSIKDRKGYSLPDDDLPELNNDSLLPAKYVRDEISGMPELSELDVVRHFTRLSTWNYSIDHGFYPLGSCTMKYNPKINEVTAGLCGFTHLHPLTPASAAQGALEIMYRLEKYLSEISGLSAVTLQPSAGAQGELTGMLMIKAFHQSRTDSNRNIVLIPDSAHGTNPASSVIAGLTTRTLASGPDGCLDIEALTPHLNGNLAALMMTNPNTLGIFEKKAVEITKLVHDCGGLVYMDGANLNALMGIVKPGDLGVDVLHINLHKTFATPHGGGGPGSGPVAVTKTLEPFLPAPSIKIDPKGFYYFDWHRPLSIGKVHNFWGNFGVMIKAYTYIRSLGAEGIRKVSEAAVLNANYMKERLKPYFHIAYDKLCKHECIFDDSFQHQHDVSTMDIAKRLMDYGFHPPTVYFPLIVKGALMIEPTESESKDTLDQFIDAMIAISEEAKTNPERVKDSPTLPKLKRLDETKAARQTVLKWIPKSTPNA
ncbi:aminomethyl-transferring glycine dehydrogenase subunit GcvPB [bacterium]|nr:aminomethyl-transferring glycine dehydrogenase subunit GcvPB [candidate division CSSED10-310 bacterium]